MPLELLYVPVERYDSRWSGYVSGINGMFHNCVKSSDRNVRVHVVAPHNELLPIKSGVVLDTLTRAQWSFSQIQSLLKLIEDGQITSESVIYFEDFWTPGFEMIPYACHLKGIRPKVYAFCHAQSVDQHDFTYGMRNWLRYFEKGWAEWLTGIFVAAKELKQMLTTANIGSENMIHVTGTVMHRQTLIDQFYAGFDKPGSKRDPFVLFTSRLDKEKRPDLFLRIAQQFRLTFPQEDVTFLVLSGRKIPTEFQEQASKEGVICRTVGKEEYFAYLATSAVMINTADQDFVSYGLLDALAYDCFPLLPNYLTFPDAVGRAKQFLYQKNDIVDAVHKLHQLLELSKNRSMYCKGDGVPEIYQQHGTKYERSVERMLDIMFREKELSEYITR